MTVKLPLWDLSFDLKGLRKEAEAVGNHGREHQRLGLAACEFAPLPPLQLQARLSQGFRTSGHPRVVAISRFEVSSSSARHYIFEYLCEKLGLRWMPEHDRDLDHVLRTYLVLDKDKYNIFTFGCIKSGQSTHEV